MNETKHTPEPWINASFEDNEIDSQIFSDEKFQSPGSEVERRVHIATVYNQDANARLICVAPEMLAALLGAQNALRKAMPHLPADKEAIFCGEWLDKINEVVTKATGA